MNTTYIKIEKKHNGKIQYLTEVLPQIPTNTILYKKLTGLGATYGELKADIGKILRKLCNEKKVEIIEAEACPDHIHMLVSIPPYLSISQFMGYIKSKSALMIFDRHANLKYKYGNRHFWATGYFVDTVGKNEKIIKEYIRNQLQEDYIADQIGIEEYIDPFKKEK